MDDFKKQTGAKILLKEVTDASDSSAELAQGIHRRHRGEAKKPKSNYAVTGIYMYDGTVFEGARTGAFQPGRTEITDVNNAYIGRFDDPRIFDGWWTDAGTFSLCFGP